MYAPSLHEGRGSAAADRTVGASHENLDHGDGGSEPKKGADGGGFSRGVSSRSCNLPAPAPQSVTALVGERARAESARPRNSLRDRSIERRRRDRPRRPFWEIRSDRGPGTWALARPVSTVQASAWPRAAVGRLA